MRDGRGILSARETQFLVSIESFASLSQNQRAQLAGHPLHDRGGARGRGMSSAIEHEFAVQLRSFDAGKGGADLGVPALAAFSSALLNRPLKGGLAVIGRLNLGGSIETVHNPLDLVELAIEKGATSVLMPVSCRRALIDLSDEAAAKVQTIFYLDPGDALRKALHDG